MKTKKSNPENVTIETSENNGVVTENVELKKERKVRTKKSKKDNSGFDVLVNIAKMARILNEIRATGIKTKNEDIFAMVEGYANRIKE